MTSLLTPAEASPASATPLPLEEPHSLRRRGPALVEIVDDRGIAPALNKGGFILHSGRCYTLRVRPQQPDSCGRVEQVTISPGDVFRTLIPVVANANGGSPDYTTTLRGRLVRPAPLITDIFINVYHTCWGPFSLAIPVVVRPSFRNQLAWASAFLGGAALGGLVRALLTGEDVQGLAAVSQWLQDSSLWLRGVVILLGLLIGLRVFSWFPIPFMARDD